MGHTSHHQSKLVHTQSYQLCNGTRCGTTGRNNTNHHTVYLVPTQSTGVFSVLLVQQAHLCLTVRTKPTARISQAVIFPSTWRMSMSTPRRVVQVSGEGCTAPVS